ncbi:unnamed protein product [Mesocestoides corti]|uniref:Uncharacterized protein n=1 Tax=Mesocestoides corti TaxID=53468 RepID=A0A158QUG3_MESCO|nr:unnamed protein product [Mesocestoides corti]
MAIFFAILMPSKDEQGPASWVRSLLSNPCETLVSTPNIISTFPDPLRVERVRTRKANLFELRSHILSRQCALLQATDRIAELPLRAVRTIRLASKESRDLKLRVSPSQLYFWTFICSLQTLEIFRRGTPCSIKPEHFRKLRQKYLIENKIFQASSLHICSPSVLTTEDESICPSTLSETASSILMSARLEALESLDFLEDASLQTEGTFNILARAVFASVVADDSAKSGRIVSHNQILIGTSQWTVDLWRRACTALARLGRYLELWPNAERSSDKDALNSTQDIMLLSMLKLLRNLTSSNNESEKPGHLHFAGSFGAQLAVAFISPESFEETYRKFAGACIFFQFCYGAKRASMYTSLELADFYRDARKFIQAESLYQRATEVLMKTSWTELATYSLLQQAFCQQVQWRTETVDTIEASVFKRYVQTALILSITPADYLENCYKILSNRCSHFDSLFEDGTASYEEAILPPWWPEDWWKHAVSTVAEHYARISSSSTSDVLPLHRVCPPLAVLSLRPLFHLSLIELDDANPHTGRQVVRIHLFVAGVRPILARRLSNETLVFFFARVSLRGRSTVVRDWTEPPLSNESNDLRSCDQAKFFNVDLAVEGSLPGAPASSAENAFTTKDHGSGHSTSGSSNAAKESVMRRLFRRSSVRWALVSLEQTIKGRSSRGMFRQSNNNLNATDDGSVSDGKPTRRPASIDFLAFRGRLSTPDRASPLSLASLQDGLTLSSEERVSCNFHVFYLVVDYDRDVRSSAATPDETSTFGASVFSAEGVRRHKKGFSMSDWSGLLQAFKQTKNAAVPKPQQTHPNKNHHLTPVVTTTQSEIDHNDIYFYPRCHARRLCKCRLPEAAKELVDSKGDALTLHPGYNYLMLETAQCGFHLPREISIAIYNGTEDAVSGSSIFNFTGLIAPEHFGSTWSNRTLLGRLLPQVEQVAALRVPKSIDSPNKSAKGVFAVI